jgi:hypothetical protein
MIDATHTVRQSHETSRRTSNLLEQRAHGSENHRRAERESRVHGEHGSSCVHFKVNCVVACERS